MSEAEERVGAAAPRRRGACVLLQLVPSTTERACALCASVAWAAVAWTLAWLTVPSGGAVACAHG